jgi:hypothetical protein
MNSLTGLRVALLLTVGATTWPTAASAQTTPVLPSPLSLGDVIQLASERRDEIQAARARTRAGEHGPPSCPHSRTHDFALARSPALLAGRRGRDEAKNAKPKSDRGIGFEDIVFHIERGDLLDILEKFKTRKELTSAEEARIGELVKKAVS